EIEVDDRDGGMLLVEELDRACRLGRHEGDQVSLLHQEREQPTQVPIVIDEQDLGAPGPTTTARVVHWSFECGVEHTSTSNSPRSTPGRKSRRGVAAQAAPSRQSTAGTVRSRIRASPRSEALPT